MVLYLLLLFGIAHFAVLQRQKGKSIVSNPYVYALSLCVYVSAWTFYGSIGRAATSGLEFIPVYLGPVLAMLLGWTLVRKMVRISKEFRLTSVGDFISFRYGRSYAVGAVVAVACLLMTAPYVALQLIAISTSLSALSGPHLLGFDIETTLLVAALIGAFAVIFGARQLDPMERHEGMVAAVAFESVIKLVSFLLVGIYVTYGIFGGYGQILEGLSRIISQSPEQSALLHVNYTSWFTVTLISFFAVLLLPRQFHVMAVEISDEAHIRKAMWIFPLYLLLINLFVPAIAWGGLILNIPGSKDAFVINLPYTYGQDALALFVFIGGVSAATAMVLVSSVAVGTMMLNDLEMPYFIKRTEREKNLPGLLLNLRRLNILLVIALGYIYSRAVAYQSLADIGIVSFLGASQLAPAALGGLYWKKGNREGAIAGLVSGILIWIYTALVPSLAEGGLVPQSLITQGLFGIGALRPTALFGLGIDPWTNSMFWSLLINSSLYVLISLASRPSQIEEALTENFVDIYKGRSAAIPMDKVDIKVRTVDELEAILAQYVGQERAKRLTESELTRLNAKRDGVNTEQLLEMWSELVKTLTGSVGSSATRMIVEEKVSVKPVLEAAEATKPAYELTAGKIYLAPDKAYEIFKDQITHGIEGLCITRLDPEEVRRTWGFKETPIIKLSNEKGGDRYISPTNLPLLYLTIKSFVESSKNSIVLVDSIEFLADQNRGLVPDRDLLDFVYQLEVLSRKSRLILAERPSYVHVSLGQDVTVVKELIFSLGPLSSYLFKAFSDAMLSGLDQAAREDVIREGNASIESGKFLDGCKQEQPLRGSSQEDDASGSCDPDMAAAAPNLAESRPSDLDLNRPLTRREFFTAIRHLARIIRRHKPDFDMMAALGSMMKSYGRSPYEVTLVPGTTYVIEEEKPGKSLEIFSELVNHGMDGLCISRYNPRILSDRFNIPTETIVWMTQKSESEYRSVDPTNFPRLSSILSDFLQKANYPVILLEGLGYLITQSNYETVLRFIQSQRDDIALKSAILLVHIDPLSLDTKELHRLESEMEPLESSESLK